MKIYNDTAGKLLSAFLALLLVLILFPVNISAATLTEKNGLKYIEQENGNLKLYTGWTIKVKSNKRFYYKNGKKLSNCWLAQNGVKQYYLTNDGYAAIGKVTIAGTEYEFDQSGKLIQDEWNIKVETANISKTGLTVITTISEDSYNDEFIYGVPFTIEEYSENKWQPLPLKRDGILWADIAYVFNVGKNENVYQWEN